MTFTGFVNDGVACITDGERTFEIHPIGEAKDRKFYHLPAAEALANGHAAIATAQGTGAISSLRQVS